jgi:hypothetical protein
MLLLLLYKECRSCCCSFLSLRPDDISAPHHAGPAKIALLNHPLLTDTTMTDAQAIITMTLLGCLRQLRHDLYQK